MKAALLVGTLAFAATLYAQAPGAAPPAGSTANPSYPQIPAGSSVVVSAQLLRGIDAKKAKPGDPIVAKCTQDLTVGSEVLIPRNGKLVGHVVSVQAKGRGNPESVLAIAFDKAILRDGREIPVAAAIQALIPPPAMVDEGGETVLGIRNVRSAKPRTTALFPGTLKTAPSASPSPADPTGVVGLKGMQLEAAPASETSVIHSNSQNVRLESGTRLILRVSLP